MDSNEVGDFRYRLDVPANHPYAVFGNIICDGHDDPYDWEDHLFAWIHAITVCGINPTECLEYETQWHMKRQRIIQGIPIDNPIRSSLIMRNVYGFNIPTREMKAVADGPANEVCIEFARLGAYMPPSDDPFTPPDRWASVLETEHPHRCWKLSDTSRLNPDLWPFTSGLMAHVETGIYATATSPLNVNELELKMAEHHGYTKEGHRILVQSYSKALRLRDERFRRRQRRKERGSGTWWWSRKKKKNAMPGSWVDG